MRALCLITVKPGIIDSVTETLFKKRKISSEIMTVTGRADICALLHGSLNDINNTVLEFKKIKGIVSTETLVEVEVDMGW
jgi:hypothetical protein|tara:strand:+ start:23 stop:262 length:240 start_codon:yes stop_codon:yes gene_type:complete